MSTQPLTASERRPRSWGSLERRLPLMISGLLAITVTAFGILAFKEVRRSSSESTMNQLRTVIGQTLDNAARTSAARLDVAARAASNPAMLGLFDANADDRAKQAGMTYLMGRRGPADSVLVTQLVFNKEMQRRLLIGRDPSPMAMRELTRVTETVVRRDSATVGRFFVEGNNVFYWHVMPVRANGAIVGFLGDCRWLRGAPATNDLLKRLTGQNITVYFASIDGERWIDVAGVPHTPRFSLASLTDTFHVRMDDGTPVMGVKSAVRGTPWVVLFTVTQADVNARSVAFLERIGMIGAVLLALAMLAAWILSRRVTRPLVSLTHAARALADGDFARREHATTTDELGELAQAFNGMAERIGQSHEELGKRIHESEALALQIHARNQELEVAQQAAVEARLISDRARADALQASKAKTEFMAMMSHELRTPLSAIAGYAEILELGIRGELNDAQRLDLSRIRANQVHLLHIINDILDLTQVESGQLSMELRPVLLRDVFEDLEPIVLPLLEGRDLAYEVESDAARLVALAERERLTQVLVNLVANAIRFSKSGGKITIRGVVTRNANANGNGGGHDRLRLHVVDTGIGIPADKQELVFQPFMQVETGASRRAHGTGLGLAISRRIVEAMGGVLTLESELGVGSTFTIELGVVDVAVMGDGVSRIGRYERDAVMSAPSD